MTKKFAKLTNGDLHKIPERTGKEVFGTLSESGENRSTADKIKRIKTIIEEYMEK